jgi:D-alanyl-lipoteichoic acid acyltransferase DltB (MBOAT superfamily)
MVFTSFVYIAFLLGVLALYFSAPVKLQRILLLCASYAFYAYWKPQYLLMLFGITTVDYVAARRIESMHDKGAKRLWLAASIVANLGLLFTYKYYDFVAGQLNNLSSWCGWEDKLPILGLLIPLGLSFHTFQSISYTVDVYRGSYKAERSYIDLALFISFFPQLVAGPIERARHLLPQLTRVNRFSLEACLSGALLIAYGFFKKLVLADNLAVLVDQYFAPQGDATGGLSLIAVYAFALQIYFDFSGYTDIARGSGRMLGIAMMENFRAPYFSTSVREFWRRWHISLTDWFREFVYHPLLAHGVNRGICVVIVFALSGIWHGANWTFLVWGLLNACFYFMMADYRPLPHLSNAIATGASWDTWAIAVARCVISFHLLCLTWVFFRAANIAEAMSVLRDIAGGAIDIRTMIARVVSDHPFRLAIIAGAITTDACLTLLAPQYQWIESLSARKSLPYWLTMMLFVYITLFLGQLGAEQFIYFQF